jgi:oxygen-independent coproporphyrinogen-3 oxidase
MKTTQLWFNKRSRFIKETAIPAGATPTQLAEFDPDNLRTRLASLLKIQNDFFPCFDWTFPPPLLNKSTPVKSATELFAKPSVIPGRYSMYLHTPFCKSLCSFCYYPIIPGRGIDMADEYVDHLCREMMLYAETFSDQICESIYFGGGTPSYLENRLLAKIFDHIHRYFKVDSRAEITIEASPGTLPADKSRFLRTMGVNRLSYGIQTLDEKLLATMNRDYSVHHAMDELTHAVNIIGNINVDTMYGFEGEQENTLLATLDKFYKIGVPSFSIYSLDKQRTEFKKAFEPPRDDHYVQKIENFARAETMLQSLGYTPVLQNIFIDPARASYRHQLRRWDNLPLLAMGLGAQGYAPQRPYQNTGSLKSYYELLDAKQLPLATMDELDPELEICRELTSKLRFTHVSFGEFKFKYGLDIEQVFGHLIEALEELGYVERRHDTLRMTARAAYYNNIIPMLFAPDSFKEKLMTLPEEYLETFPVPYAMTRLGRAQSAEISWPGRLHVVNTDRRSRIDRRQMSAQANDERRRNNRGRRSSDQIQSWSTLN